MSTLLWIDTDKDEAIDLGDPFHLWTTMGEITRTCENSAEFAQLLELAEVAESQEDCDADWLARVRHQARHFLARYKADLSSRALTTLQKLS